MKRKVVYFLIIIIIIIVSVFTFLKRQELSNYKEKGNKLVEMIYEFKKINFRLPNSVSEVKTDIEMGEGPYYEKINDTTFIVFFNIGFDDKIIFNSNSKRWK